jgi:hypothetical protein
MTPAVFTDKRLFGVIHRLGAFCSATVMKLSVLNKALEKVLEAVNKQGRALILKGFKGDGAYHCTTRPSLLRRKTITVNLYSAFFTTVTPQARSLLHYICTLAGHNRPSRAFAGQGQGGLEAESITLATHNTTVATHNITVALHTNSHQRGKLPPNSHEAQP